MSRMTVPSFETAPAASQPMLEAVKKQLGVIPNSFRVLSLSPAALQGLLGLNGALGKALDLKTRERIAIAIAQSNDCDYCLSAHSYIGLNLAKIDAAEIALARKGASSDPRANAAVAFALKINEERGKVSDADVQAVKAAGFTDGQIVEIIAVVAENIFTNLLNIVAGTEIDFPVVLAAEAA
ncbi:MAG: alkylhydroperoxidase [Acidiphilium sp. 37-64-53]|uniref:carboxymuconolactone decarboxylase family protein n=1 Tax=unclassified Acidiphilium TaxID=2617493 RepID=UPI000BD7E8A8|nr:MULTISPECIES: carboxymuconolactone decarboxylase family protein [unclassified Acidiphilium]OYV99867.1 MAG: alkylhydroperoxidase [Acidiphilium sp. 37-64-53]OZB22881.1 MAG: alkylhydroperoxidase [Acidiphilium sp. 34-64-41]HQT90049.1 carboxymuconolactone decarboxylase family protein [Acidiphilium sp.]